MPRVCPHPRATSSSSAAASPDSPRPRVGRARRAGHAGRGATTLGGRVRSWPVAADGTSTTMSRGFHAFFRQYYNLRSLLRRTDPTLDRLRPVDDYPLVRGRRCIPTPSPDIPRTPPLNLVAFVARSPSFDPPRPEPRRRRRGPRPARRRLPRGRTPTTTDVAPPTSSTGSASRQAARHLALEVFARSFFADPRDFSGGELVAMFHTYFVGSAEGLLFDVPHDDYDTTLWAPLGALPARPRGLGGHRARGALGRRAR